MGEAITKVLLLVSILSVGNAHAFDCLELVQAVNGERTQPLLPDDDFVYRDSLLPTEVARGDWGAKRFASFGPCPNCYPTVEIPAGEGLAWIQKRLELVARKYLGLPYEHRHIPQMGGIDCSNFTAWIYNWGFGHRFSSHVERQAETAGRRLAPHEPWQKGDLIFFWDDSGQRIKHVGMYLNDGLMIESRRRRGVVVSAVAHDHRPVAWVRRVFE